MDGVAKASHTIYSLKVVHPQAIELFQSRIHCNASIYGPQGKEKTVGQIRKCPDKLVSRPRPGPSLLCNFMVKFLDNQHVLKLSSYIWGRKWGPHQVSLVSTCIRPLWDQNVHLLRYKNHTLQHTEDGLGDWSATYKNHNCWRKPPQHCVCHPASTRELDRLVWSWGKCDKQGNSYVPRM